MTAHARLSPSGAHRWMRCPGSVVLEAGLPDTPSAYAEEGTKAHELAATVLNGRDWLQVTGYDIDTIQHVQKYTEYVRMLAEGNQLLVEQRVDFSDALGVPDSFGTSDCVILTDDEIMIVDLKYGRGVQVDADDNEQLQLYALGALNEFDMIGDFKSVRLVIHQPRLDHVSEWTISVNELREFGEAARNRAAYVLAQTEPATRLDLVPGEKQCRFCKAKGTCPALAEKVHETVLSSFDDLEAAAQAVPAASGSTVGFYLGEVDLIETWCKAVREKAFTELSEGREVPGYKLVEGRRGARKWADEKVAEAQLKAMRLKVEEMYSLELISPTTAEKLHKVGVIGPRQWPKVQDLITQPSGKPSVASENDKRPAISLVATADDFEVVT